MEKDIDLMPGDIVYHISTHIYDTQCILMTVCDEPYDCYGNVRVEWRTQKGARVFSAHPRHSLRLHERGNHKNAPKWKEL